MVMPKAVCKPLNVLTRIIECRLVVDRDALMSVSRGDQRAVWWEVHMQMTILASFIVATEVVIALEISVG